VPGDHDGRDRIRVVGYRLIQRPRVLIWISALNTSNEQVQRLTEYQLEDDGGTGSLWYQHMRLPWPIRDRPS